MAKILTDTDIFSLLRRDPKFISGFPTKWSGKPPETFGNDSFWTTKDSPVQPCSVDLHVGTVFDPAAEPDARGSQGNGIELFELEPGHTAIVATLETLKFPSKISAIGSPPTTVSFNHGLLMVNPGHIDPGFEGQLRLIVINMGRKMVTLQKDEPIVTLVLFESSDEPTRPYLARTQGPVVTQTVLDQLSPDFLNVEERACAIADRTARALLESKSAELSTAITDSKTNVERAVNEAKALITSLRNSQSVVASIATVIVAAIVGYGSYSAHSSNAALSDRITKIEACPASANVLMSIESVEKRLAALERSTPK